PFTESQRAWLNGFVAGLLGMERAQGSPGPPAAAPQIDEDFPWHDPTLALDERMKLAHGRSFERQLMAAMGQLDCGQCGYLCKTYAEAIAALRSEEHTSELQSHLNLVCRLLLEKKKSKLIYTK